MDAFGVSMVLTLASLVAIVIGLRGVFGRPVSWDRSDTTRGSKLASFILGTLAIIAGFAGIMIGSTLLAGR
ncbi:MAG: hypothetical protein WD768_23085 [Phycisphaeraceae bacterium]